MCSQLRGPLTLASYDGPTRRRCSEERCETQLVVQHNALRERARFCRFVLRRRGSRAGARRRGVMV